VHRAGLGQAPHDREPSGLDGWADDVRRGRIDDDE